jgi:hypothetical protein
MGAQSNGQQIWVTGMGENYVVQQICVVVNSKGIETGCHRKNIANGGD